MLKQISWLAAAATVCLTAAADDGKPAAARPGGANHQAFRLDTETKMADVLRNNEKIVNRSGHKYRWEDYLALLGELSNRDRYVVCPGREFVKTFDPEKVVVYMRHDIDIDPATALRMSEEERKRGLRASYYILPTAHYYGRQTKTGVERYTSMDQLYRQLQNAGHEIGVHNDLLSMMILWDIDPLEFQKQELDYYHANGFPVTGIVSHGSGVVLSRKLNNTWMFSEFKRPGVYEIDGRKLEYGKHSVRDFGFDYEGYRAGQKFSTGDISGFKTGREVAEKMQTFRPGDRVSLLTHPIHWGDRQ